MKRIAFRMAFLWVIASLAGSILVHAAVQFTGTELLCRPTDHSIAVNIMTDTTIQAYVQYGTQSGAYDGKTDTATATANVPLNFVLDGLRSDMQYFYRVVYREINGASWTNRTEHSFRTQRSRGSTFNFSITSDTHPNFPSNFFIANEYAQTLNNMAADNPDFFLDLGDTFPLDDVSSDSQARKYFISQRPYLGLVAHSAPFFSVLGNHEFEQGWNLDNSPSLPIMSVNAKKMYYPSPIPNEFYTGDEETNPNINGDQLKEDYYAWEWGDALFVAIDPYWYTMIVPADGTTFPYPGNGGNSEPQGTRWDWTLGDKQYQWLKQTLQNSKAKFKFVFAHQVTGGVINYGRGGAAAAPYFEWGGYNWDGTWGFDTHRPGWEMPIHQLMVENGVTVFFHGHDHFYGMEPMAGIIYQECPMPANTGNANNGAYDFYGFYDFKQYPAPAVILPDSGHLRVTVSPDQVKVDYVRSYLSGSGSNGNVAFSYTVNPTNAPNAPVLVRPVDSASTSSTDPVLEVQVADPEAKNLDVTFYGRMAGGSFKAIGKAKSVASGAKASIAWSGLESAKKYEWYAKAYNGLRSTITSTWSFTIPSIPHHLAMTVNSTTGGITNPSIGDHIYEENSVVAITAIPSVGYSFDHWEGNVDKPYSVATNISLNGDKNATAYFVESTVKLEYGVVAVGGDRVTVHLAHAFSNPVVVSSIQLLNNSVPVVTRISGIASTSFNIRLQNPSGRAVVSENVHYLVAEKGVWTVDGVRFEAQTYLSTVTDGSKGWTGQSQSYGQVYANPVVVGQVMSENDSRWSAFWCQGSARAYPPSSSVLKTGKMIGEDSITTRANETIGYVVFETEHGKLDGVEFEAALGPKTIKGLGDSPPYPYTFKTAFPTKPQILLTTMAGVNSSSGGWALAYGSAPSTSTTLSLAVDRDQIAAGNRAHAAEQVGYVVFLSAAKNRAPIANADKAKTGEGIPVAINILANDTDPDGDTLTVSAVTQPAHGSVEHTATNVTYLPAIGFSGDDSFNYTVSDGKGGQSTAAVSVTTVSNQDYTISMNVKSGGAVAAGKYGNDAAIHVGYAKLLVTSGITPYGTAVFSYKQNGVTISEVGVPASPPTTRARIFIDYRSDVLAIAARPGSGTVDINTGIGLVNCGSVTANITFTLRNVDGFAIATGHGTLAAGNQVAKFINQLSDVASDFGLPANFQFATLDIAGDQPLSVLALRITMNQRGEPLFTTTPVADLNQSATSSPIFFPQLADGGGFTTSFVLLNTSSNAERGTIQILDDNGRSFVVRRVGGSAASSFEYSIPPGGAFHFQTDGSTASQKAGWARVIPSYLNSSPVGSGIFSYNPVNVLLTQSGVPAALSTTHARIYVDHTNNHNTGLAIANLLDVSALYSVQVFQNDGVTPISNIQGFSLEAYGHTSQFANQLITGLPEDFTGILDISSSISFAALTLRSLENERGDFLMTTFPVADGARPAPSPVIFPQIATGGGYSTETILISPAGESKAVVSFYDQTGAPAGF
jgi:hypothetical protein